MRVPWRRRALAPVDLAIGSWKFVARTAYEGCVTVIALAATDEPMKLPPPEHGLVVRRTVAAPGSGQIV